MKIRYGRVGAGGRYSFAPAGPGCCSKARGLGAALGADQDIVNRWANGTKLTSTHMGFAWCAGVEIDYRPYGRQMKVADPGISGIFTENNQRGCFFPVGNPLDGSVGPHSMVAGTTWQTIDTDLSAVASTFAKSAALPSLLRPNSVPPEIEPTKEALLAALGGMYKRAVETIMPHGFGSDVAKYDKIDYRWYSVFLEYYLDWPIVAKFWPRRNEFIGEVAASVGLPDTHDPAGVRTHMLRNESRSQWSAYEDHHTFSKTSPEVGFYCDWISGSQSKDGRAFWSVNGKIGDNTAAGALQNWKGCILEAQFIGLSIGCDGNFMDALNAQMEAYSKSSGQIWDKFIAAGGAGTKEAERAVRFDMLLKRNIWCYNQGFDPPTYQGWPQAEGDAYYGPVRAAQLRAATGTPTGNGEQGKAPGPASTVPSTVPDESKAAWCNNTGGVYANGVCTPMNGGTGLPPAPATQTDMIPFLLLGAAAILLLNRKD